MSNTVLIVTDAFDVHADVIETKLIAKQVPVFRLNLDRESLAGTFLSIGHQVTLRKSGESVTKDNFQTVWVRRAFVELSLEERDTETVEQKIWRTEWNRSLLGLYQSLGQCRWISPLPLVVRAENKLYQWDVARRVGLKLPRTLTTNVKSELLEFCNSCSGKVAFKMLHQDVHRRDGQVLGLFTNLIGLEHLMEFESVGENPITVQEYVEKDFEVRYTVVEGQHFVCRIDSQASESTKIDWRRYDLARTPHTVILPPRTIQDQVDTLMDRLGLQYGALDFIVSPQGDWYFLEVNPVGQWLWIEDLTGLPISDALVDLLSK